MSIYVQDNRDLDAILNYHFARLLVINAYDELIYTCGNASLQHESNKLTHKRILRINGILMCWESFVQTQHLVKTMCTALIPVWGATYNIPTYHGLSVKITRAWLLTKCVIAFGRWKIFRGVEDMNAGSDLCIRGELNAYFAFGKCGS